MIRLRSAALGLALLAGTTAVAAAQTTAPSAPPTAQRGQAGGAHQRDGRRGGQHGRRALLRGVKLTDAQKTQMKAIRARYQPQYKALGESMRPALQEARAARQRGDTAATKAAFARTEGDRARLRALREREQSEVRGILTAEQRVNFDRNVAQLRDRTAKRQSRAGRKA